MALASPARYALSDLPVNSFGTPTGTTPFANQPVSRKRRIDEVDEPENIPTARKALLSPSTAVKDTVVLRRGGDEGMVCQGH